MARTCDRQRPATSPRLVSSGCGRALRSSKRRPCDREQRGYRCSSADATGRLGGCRYGMARLPTHAPSCRRRHAGRAAPHIDVANDGVEHRARRCRLDWRRLASHCRRRPCAHSSAGHRRDRRDPVRWRRCARAVEGRAAALAGGHSPSARPRRAAGLHASAWRKVATVARGDPDAAVAAARRTSAAFRPPAQPGGSAARRRRRAGQGSSRSSATALIST